MAIPKSPIDIVSYGGADPKFPIDDQEFQDLEKAYQESLSPDARRSLKKISDGYLLDRKIENSRQTWRDVAALSDSITDIAVALRGFAGGAVRRSDASYLVGAILEEVLANRPLPLDLERGDLAIQQNDNPGEWKKFSETYQLPDAKCGLQMSTSLIWDLGKLFSEAASRVSREIDERAQKSRANTEFAPIERFLLRLGDWAKTFGLKHGPYIDGEVPSPFSAFVCDLLKLTPDEYRESSFSLSPGAIASRIRKVRRRANLWKREQETASMSAPSAPFESTKAV